MLESSLDLPTKQKQKGANVIISRQTLCLGLQPLIRRPDSARLQAAFGALGTGIGTSVWSGGVLILAGIWILLLSFSTPWSLSSGAHRRISKLYRSTAASCSAAFMGDELLDLSSTLDARLKNLDLGERGRGTNFGVDLDVDSDIGMIASSSSLFSGVGSEFTPVWSSLLLCCCSSALGLEVDTSFGNCWVSVEDWLPFLEGIFAGLMFCVCQRRFE